MKKSELRKIIAEEIKSIISERTMGDLTKWWTMNPEKLLSQVYWAQRQIPPQDRVSRQQNYDSIIKQLNDKWPAPTAAYKKAQKVKMTGSEPEPELSSAEQYRQAKERARQALKRMGIKTQR